MRALVLLLLLAACGTAPAVADRSTGEGLTARIGGSAAAFYSLTR
jgi:hypothetical protein